METKKIYCFGELLWDDVNGKLLPGGAPLNAAYHLAKFGNNAIPISRVGNDELGEEILALLKKWNIDASAVQIDEEYPTGEVEAELDYYDQVYYTISGPVAWDYITLTTEVLTGVDFSDCFIYGSLAAREQLSRSSMILYLLSAPWKVFDANLRPPFYDLLNLPALLELADLIKVNEEELGTLVRIFKIPHDENSLANQAQALMDRFSIPELILTRGSQGASYFSGDVELTQAAVPVVVKDSIGCGDSFLAAFVHSRLQGEDPETCLKNAVCMGSFVAGLEGGCPEYDLSDFYAFKQASL